MSDESLNDKPLDLAVLRSDTESRRFDAVIDTIVRDAMAARANRQPQSSIARELAAWVRPALVAAAVILAIALPAVALTSYRRVSVARPVPLPATDALGIPRQLAVILHSSRDPSLAELHDAVLPDAP